MNDGTTGYGSVGYLYKIGKYEVSNSQYAYFLNAIAASDPFSLYDANMENIYGGITRSGSSGTYTYSVKPDMGDKPVNFASLFDSLRFANWLHNGKPTGSQDASTTEDGAYTLSGENGSGSRNSDARVVVPTENEWYKAVYYDVVLHTYYDYPYVTDTQTTCAAPSVTPNTANCDSAVGMVTNVGAYAESAGPSGTFDQGGNLWEWTEGMLESSRGFRGGSWYANEPSTLAAWTRNPYSASAHSLNFGFRVGLVWVTPTATPTLTPTPTVSPTPTPEPGAILQLVAGGLGLVFLSKRRMRKNLRASRVGQKSC